MVKNNKYQQEANIKTIVEATAETVFDKKYSSIKEENKALKLLMGGVVLVLFVGFITLLATVLGIVFDNSRAINQAGNIQEDMKEIKTDVKNIKLRLEEK